MGNKKTKQQKNDPGTKTDQPVVEKPVENKATLKNVTLKIFIIGKPTPFNLNFADD